MLGGQLVRPDEHPLARRALRQVSGTSAPIERHPSWDCHSELLARRAGGSGGLRRTNTQQEIAGEGTGRGEGAGERPTEKKPLQNILGASWLNLIDYKTISIDPSAYLDTVVSGRTAVGLRLSPKGRRRPACLPVLLRRIRCLAPPPPWPWSPQRLRFPRKHHLASRFATPTCLSNPVLQRTRRVSSAY